MRILVTGGLGFIGSHYVDLLYERTDAEVLILDEMTYAGINRPNEGRDRVTLMKGDIKDFDLVRRTIQRMDSVVHFAAESHVDKSISEGTKFAETNVVGTAALLESCRETSMDSFVYVSTDEVYGDIQEGEFAEDDRLNPRNPYSASKAGGDHLTKAYHETHGIPTIRARPTNCYGPRQHQEKFIPKCITNALNGDNIPIYGDGKQVREWLYVKDCARAIEKIRTEGQIGEAYNIGSRARQYNVDVAEMIIDAVGASDDLLEFVSDRPGHDERYAVDSDKIRSLGWEPQNSFHQGMRKTIEHFRE